MVFWYASESTKRFYFHDFNRDKFNTKGHLSFHTLSYKTNFVARNSERKASRSSKFWA